MSVTFPASSDRSVLIASATDKTGLLPFTQSSAQIQQTHGRALMTLSTGGTYKTLSEGDARLAVMEVQELTGFPEMMGGRLKTLHPLVH